MNDPFKGTSLVFIMAVIQIQTEGVNIGKCSLGSFTNGGLACQRAMMIELKQRPSMSCSLGRSELQICLRKHVDRCVKDDSVLKDMADQITDFMLLYAYNCGDEEVNTGNIGPFLWLITKCAPERLKKAYECWREFHSVLSQSRNNVTNACRPYAKAKEDCNTVAKAACEGLCDYLKIDDYNPFCAPNFKDPVSGTNQSACTDLHAKLECPISLIYEEAMECEDEGAAKFANEGDHTCSKENDRNRKCLENRLGTCRTTMKNIEDTQKALQATLTTERLFCNNVSLDTSELHPSVLPLVDCDEEFFNEAENCARTFRNTYQTSTTAERQSGVTCSVYMNDYQEARECINNARKIHCNFQLEVLDTTATINNPFCSHGNTKHSSALLQLVASLVPLLLFLSVK